MFAAHRVDEQLAKGMDRKVWLPSGGSLVIDRTEAMTVVDVNTGKFTGSGGTLEETVTRNNLEAAEEIVRQLRLRDIGGIIVIDFIDMVLELNRDLVLRRLVECLGRDRTKHQVAEVTSLGLVQMTRKRVGQGLRRGVQRDLRALQRPRASSCTPTRSSAAARRSCRSQTPQPRGRRGRRARQRAAQARRRQGAGPSLPSGLPMVPVLPEAREAVKATLATIAAAAAHAHEHEHDGHGRPAAPPRARGGRGAHVRHCPSRGSTRPAGPRPRRRRTTRPAAVTEALAAAADAVGARRRPPTHGRRRSGDGQVHDAAVPRSTWTP